MFDPDGILAPEPQVMPRYARKTQQAIKLVAEHGVDAKTALMLVHNRPVDPSAVKAFRKKVAAHALTRPAMVKLAHNVVRDVLQGKADEVTQQKLDRNGQVVEIIDKIVPTHTNRLAAAAMVFDRVEPVINRNVTLTGELKDFMPVDLDEYS
jgi:hypothetical protein